MFVSAANCVVSLFPFLFFQPGISAEVRRKLGEAAVRAAKAVNYVGAGEEKQTITSTSLSRETKHTIF